MKKNNILKLTTSVLACLTVVVLGNHCYNTQAVNKVEYRADVEEPIIFTEVSSYDTRYDFSDSNVLKEHSDLVVIGKVTNLDTPTNLNPTTKKHGKTRTPGDLEVLKIIKNDGRADLTSVEFLEYGGTISYSEYEKSLLPAQKAKRDYLMSQNGLTTAKSNVFVKQSVENQLEIEEGKTYIMYLIYNEDFDRYMVINQPYGVKEYNTSKGTVFNHVTNTVETIEEIM